jgi:LmbE family N-acetylglucosaminyl deacetylase
MTDRFTIVSFHAHPDDEALLTSGTLARAAADGHRVVIVVATAGEAGLTGTPCTGAELAARRTAELSAAAHAIGAARLELLGHPDTGWPDRGSSAPPFSRLPIEPLAADLADLLVDEHADVLTTYDEHGGYGHPDHIHVHRVGALAAHLAATPVVLEATIDRDRIVRAARLLHLLSHLTSVPQVPDLTHAYTPRSLLTHRVDVRRHLGAKYAALRAHASQTTGGDARTLALLLRLPPPLQRAVLGYEWFREPGRPPGRPLLDDIFATLR